MHHTALEAGIDLAHAADVDEEIGELVHAFGKGFDFEFKRALILEQVPVMTAEGCGAGAGWRDDEIAAREGADGLEGEISRRFAVSRIEGGLAAARLRRWHDDHASRLLDQVGVCKAHGGPHEIDQAGDE